MEQILSISLALIAGAAARWIGKSRLTGWRGWHRVLAPATAIAAAVAARAVTGGETSVESILDQGGADGATAIALWTAGKNLWQFATEKQEG